MKSLKTIAVQVAVKILNQPSVLTLPFFAVVAGAADGAVHMPLVYGVQGL